MQLEIPRKKSIDCSIIICPPSGILSPSYGVASLVSYLKSKKISVALIDMNIEMYNDVDKASKKLWEDRDLQWSSAYNFGFIKKKFYNYILSYSEKIIKSKTRTAAFSVTRYNILIAYELVKIIKNKSPETKIIFGGPGITLEEERRVFYNDRLIDFFILGYGEKRLFEIINNIKSNLKIENINDIVYKNREGNYIITKISEKYDIPTLEEEIINSRIIVDFDEFKINQYRVKSLPLLSSIGCVGKCTYCSDTVLMGKYTFIPPEKIFNQIITYIKRYNITSFDFNDLAINGNTKELERLCDLIIGSKISISWSANAIPKEDLRIELLKKMKKAGCSLLRIGIETGSARILKLMNKYSTPKIGERVLKDCRTIGISSSINLIVGFPGETETEFQETIDFIKKNRENIPEIGNISTCFVTPHSAIEKNPISFDVTLPRYNHWNLWHDKSGNDYNARRKKAFRLKKEAENLKIPIGYLNVFDDEDNHMKINEKLKRDLEKKPKDDSIGEIPNKKDILLVNPPPWGTDNPPIGLAYLSSYLENKNLSVEIFDFNIDLFNNINPSLKHLWHFENKNFWRDSSSFKILLLEISENIDISVDRIVRSSASIIGFSVVDPKELITIELIKKVKSIDPSKIIILGGPACSTEDSRKIFIEKIPSYIDAFVVNEGEETIYDIIMAHKKKNSFDKIPGLVTYKKGKYSTLIEREKKDINDLIFPTYRGFDLDKYTTQSLTLVWSRGCIGNCAFCKIKGLWKGYQFRNPENIVEELEYHSNTNKINRFTIADPTINGDLKKLEKVCDLIIEKDLKVNWFGQGIPSRGMTLYLLRKMKKAGCYKLEYGVESGSDKILKRMRKPYSKNIIEKTLKNTFMAEIPAFIFIIIGFPGETEKDFQDTMDFIERNKQFIAAVKSVNTLHLIDDTDVFEKKEEFGIKIIDPGSRHINWVSDNGKNSYEIRKERTRRMIKLLKKLGIPLLETNLNEGKEGKLRESFGLNDPASGLNLLKKEISEIDGTLYHPNPELLLQSKKKTNITKKKNLKIRILKKIVDRLKFIDGVDLGIEKSELRHASFDTWGKKTSHITSSYGDKNNLANPSSNMLIRPTNWRDFAMTTGVILNILPLKKKQIAKKGAILKIKSFDNAYNQGKEGHPTFVSVSNDGQDWFRIGHFTIKGQETWIIYSFKIDNVLLNSDKLYVRLDDSLNYQKLKTGKKISWIRLYKE